MSLARLFAASLKLCPQITQVQRFSTFLAQPKLQLLDNAQINKVNVETTRTFIKYSWKDGKRVADPDVLKRFFRLHWGGWIRRKAGCHKRLWRKSWKNRCRLEQHVLCNGKQSYLLDKMVTSQWRKPKYFVEDPYAPYHSRENFIFTYTKPRPYFPPENEKNE